ncbi:MAG: type II toxin-antitoxin system prevent-host-death family antitoxin [Mesorhizobium sp.]|nr:MAG: type II toxin-antitoxin system prevent-host-death family antitoxin [Mesorhizobium sp.]
MGKRTELTKAKRPAPRVAAGRWKFEDAKARFSEVVRHAREEGPQRVSVRGHDAVVAMSVEEFERLAAEKPRPPFVQFMERLHLGGLDLELDLERELDRGRHVEL